MKEGECTQEATRRWLTYARADLQEARINIEHGGVPHIACFHAQQAVEKAIKALYVWMASPFDLIHDLDRLRNQLPGNWSVKSSFPDLSVLSFWAVNGRYPGEWTELTRDEALEALDVAERLLKEVTEDLAQQGYIDITD